MLDAPRRLGIAADGVQPAAPHQPRRQQQADERERRSTTKIEYGIQSIEPPPIVCTIGGMPEISVPSRGPQREAADDAEAWRA